MGLRPDRPVSNPVTGSHHHGPLGVSKIGAQVAPHLHCPVWIAAEDNAFAVGAEGHAGDRAWCPLRVRVSLPLSASHTFTGWFIQLAEARRLPSGLKATRWSPSSCAP